MKLCELTKQLQENNKEVTNKQVIKFLNDNGYPKVTSHMSNLTDEQIDLITNSFTPVNETVETKAKSVVEEAKEDTSVKKTSVKKFAPDDLIECKSVTPWEVIALGVDGRTTYHWTYFGDVDYVAYRDLQAFRRKEYITKPLIIIQDPDLCEQWKRDLGSTYKYFLDVDYPEDFFVRTDDDFRDLLVKAPQVIKDVIKNTALTMIRAENYPTVSKINIIDELCGTCLKEVL